MTREQMIAAIVQYIQDDANLLIVIRLSATTSISMMEETQLTGIMTRLGLPISGE